MSPCSSFRGADRRELARTDRMAAGCPKCSAQISVDRRVWRHLPVTVDDRHLVEHRSQGSEIAIAVALECAIFCCRCSGSPPRMPTRDDPITSFQRLDEPGPRRVAAFSMPERRRRRGRHSSKRASAARSLLGAEELVPRRQPSAPKVQSRRICHSTSPPPGGPAPRSSSAREGSGSQVEDVVDSRLGLPTIQQGAYASRKESTPRVGPTPTVRWSTNSTAGEAAVPRRRTSMGPRNAAAHVPSPRPERARAAGRTSA